MDIILVATICTILQNVPLCEDVRIPTENMVAGKVDDPVPYPFTARACRGSGLGLITAQEWTRQFRPGYWVKQAQCVPPKLYVPKGRA